MFIETETSNNGASIILSGKEIHEMQKIKKIIKKLLRLARNL